MDPLDSTSHESTPFNTIQHLEANVEYLKCIAQQAAPATVQAVGCVKLPPISQQIPPKARCKLRRMSSVQDVAGGVVFAMIETYNDMLGD